MATRVRIKDTHSPIRDHNTILGLVYGETDVIFQDVFPDSHGAILLVPNSNLAQLLSADTIASLQAIGLTTVPPTEFQAQRTIFISRLHSLISAHPTDDIIAELETKNSFLKVNRAYLIDTGPTTRSTLKLTLESVDQVSTALSQGLSAFGIKIDPRRISKERFYSIKQCFRCFSYEHYTSSCTAEQARCSICSGTHHFKTCPSPLNMKCPVCSGDHIGISPRCPKRQEVIKGLQEETATNHHTIPEALQQHTTYVPAPLPVTNAWGIPNQTSTSAQHPNQAASNPGNPVTQQTTASVHSHQHSSAPVYSPPSDTIADHILEMAKFASGGDPVKFIMITNALRKDNNLPTIIVSRETLHLIDPSQFPDVSDDTGPPPTFPTVVIEDVLTATSQATAGGASTETTISTNIATEDVLEIDVLAEPNQATAIGTSAGGASTETTTSTYIATEDVLEIDVLAEPNQATAGGASTKTTTSTNIATEDVLEIDVLAEPNQATALGTSADHNPIPETPKAEPVSVRTKNASPQDTPPLNDVAPSQGPSQLPASTTQSNSLVDPTSSSSVGPTLAVWVNPRKADKPTSIFCEDRCSMCTECVAYLTEVSPKFVQQQLRFFNKLATKGDEFEEKFETRFKFTLQEIIAERELHNWLSIYEKLCGEGLLTDDEGPVSPRVTLRSKNPRRTKKC